MSTSTAPGPPRAAHPVRVLVLGGPSGAGKSRLAARLQRRHGWPVVTLDDFYKDGDDPTLPRSSLGIVDWDDPRSWDADGALEALLLLARGESADVPVYDISRSLRTGSRTLRAGTAPVIVAEGIFAAETIAPLADAGLLADAWCIGTRPWVTFTRRLARDLAERRKPPLVLWRRGHLLRRAEPGIVAAQVEKGATALSATRAEQLARQLVSP